MATLHLTTENQINDILKQKGVAVVDFTATWCPPCRMIGPVAQKLAEAKGVTLIKVDIDKAGSLADRFKVTSIPNFMLFQNSLNNKLNEFKGANKDQLQEMFAVAASLL